MKTATAQQEILLVTTSSLSKRQLCEKLDAKSSRSLSASEQIEEACWNGLLNEMIPEIMLQATTGRKLYIWHIRQGASLLQIELSEFPIFVEKQFSIDPNFFLPNILYS